MDGMFIFGFIAVVIGISVVLFDKFYLSKKRKLKGNLVRVLLFEQSGNEKVYIGETLGVQILDSKLGLTIKLKQFDSTICGVNPDLFFFDKKVGKTLLVCRFSEEDYRPMHRLVHNNFFVKEKIKRQKKNSKGELLFKEEKVIDPETGEVFIDKKPVYEEFEELVKYDEPLGITQTARESLRFYKDFSKRMQEKRGEKMSWWDKYGTTFMVGAMLLIILISTAYNSNKFEESSKNIAAVFDENMKEAIHSVNQPSFIDNIYKSIENKNKEASAPPN